MNARLLTVLNLLAIAGMLPGEDQAPAMQWRPGMKYEYFVEQETATLGEIDSGTSGSVAARLTLEIKQAGPEKSWLG